MPSVHMYVITSSHSHMAIMEHFHTANISTANVSAVHLRDKNTFPQIYLTYLLKRGNQLWLNICTLMYLPVMRPKHFIYLRTPSSQIYTQPSKHVDLFCPILQFHFHIKLKSKYVSKSYNKTKLSRKGSQTVETTHSIPVFSTNFFFWGPIF